MDINKVFTGDTFKAEDLEGQDLTLTITNVGSKEFENKGVKTAKLIIAFNGEEKKLVVNKTNAKRIAAMYGNETNNWIGKTVILYEEMVEFQGNLVPAIRVRVQKKRPQTARPSSAEMGRQNVDDDIPF